VLQLRLVAYVFLQGREAGGTLTLVTQPAELHTLRLDPLGLILPAVVSASIAVVSSGFRRGVLGGHVRGVSCWHIRRESSWHSSWVGGRCWRLLTLVLQLGVVAHVLLQRREPGRTLAFIGITAELHTGGLRIARFIPPAVVAPIFAVVRGRLSCGVLGGHVRGASRGNVSRRSGRTLGWIPRGVFRWC
jgi:hypothetical protein